MPDILSQDEIDALLSATGSEEGGSDAGADLSPSNMKAQATRPVVTYDFKHPARVSKDQQRTLENLHANLARLMASSFSTLQRSVVDCDIAFVDQTTYAEFIMSLSNPSCSYTFSIEPLGGPSSTSRSLWRTRSSTGSLGARVPILHRRRAR
jgi:flagellar motor switch protein FliM